MNVSETGTTSSVLILLFKKEKNSLPNVRVMTRWCRGSKIRNVLLVIKNNIYSCFFVLEIQVAEFFYNKVVSVHMHSNLLLWKQSYCTQGMVHSPIWPAEQPIRRVFTLRTPHVWTVSRKKLGKSTVCLGLWNSTKEVQGSSLKINCSWDTPQLYPFHSIF